MNAGSVNGDGEREQQPQSMVSVQIGDFVCFERVGADREWRNTLGKVLSFPTSQRARVVWYDRAEDAQHTGASMDERLHELATRNGQLQLWEEKQELEQQLTQAAAEEEKASRSLFSAREVTLQRQAAAATVTRESMEALDRARDALDVVPARQWRDMRAPGRPTETLVSLSRAVMLALQEERATSWEAMQFVMRQPDFMDRIMTLDCTAAPLSKSCRKKMRKELGSRQHSPSSPAGTRSRTGGEQRRASSFQGTQLEVALYNWLQAQMNCSDAREAEETTVDDCFADHQEQAVLVREVNSMRENISMMQEKIKERKQAICGNTPLAALMLEDGAEGTPTVDSLFYERIDANGRPVTEIILLGAVLASFGHKAEECDEDEHVFVRLSREEEEILRTAVAQAKLGHDMAEIDELYAALDREEEEIRELRQRIEELRHKDVFTEDDEEEMRQLDALLTKVIRRHETTQWRLRCLQKEGRDPRFIEANRSADLVDSDLHVKFSGDKWKDLIEDEMHRTNLEGAFRRGMAQALGLPPDHVSNIRFSLGSLLIDFTVRHSRDVDAEHLQALANEAELEEFANYYEKVTFRKTYPINTAEQIEAYQKTEEALLEKNFAGAGLDECLDDFVDSEDGETDDEDHRRAQVEILATRTDYDAAVRVGYPLYGLSEVPLAVFEAERAALAAAAAAIAAAEAEEEEARAAAEAEEAEARAAVEESPEQYAELGDAEPLQAKTRGLEGVPAAAVDEHDAAAEYHELGSQEFAQEAQKSPAEPEQEQVAAEYHELGSQEFAQEQEAKEAEEKKKREEEEEKKKKEEEEAAAAAVKQDFTQEL